MNELTKEELLLTALIKGGKKCGTCEKPVPLSVITCADCNYNKLGLPDQTKQQWVEALSSKQEKNEKPKRSPRNNSKAAEPSE